MESNGWVMWKMGTWLMTHGERSPALAALAFCSAAFRFSRRSASSAASGSSNVAAPEAREIGAVWNGKT